MPRSIHGNKRINFTEKNKQMNRSNIKIICFAAIWVITYSLSTSQVMEAQKTMSKGQNSSISIDIYDIAPSYTDDVYKDFIKEFKGKIKKDKKSNEWFSDDAKVAGIANGAPIDIYSKIEGSGNRSTVTMWVDLGAGYINSSTYPREYAEAQRLLEKFAQSVRVAKAEDELGLVEKDMKKLDSDMKKLKKDKEDYQQEIEKCKAKIKEAEAGIIKNEEDQRNKQISIEQQSIKVEDAKTKVNNLKRM